jgi:uncharacterized protein with ATP-grasp and redox domains
MNYKPYCIPCFLRRTLHTAEIATSDEWLHRKILGEIMTELARVDEDATPADVVLRIYRKTAKTLGMPDPYAEEKRRWQEEILANEAWIRERVDRSPDPYFTALKLSIAANQLDNELRPIVTLKGLVEGLDGLRFVPECFDEFRQAVEASRRVLFIHGTVGELTFDRILLEKMGKDPAGVTSVVRQAPILTDVTREEAFLAGIDRVAGAVIDPGVDCRGVPLGECSEEFRSRFQAADLIIAKGQSAYQTLDGLEPSPGGEEKEVFFLFSVKCPVMASALGSSLGELVLEHS